MKKILTLTITVLLCACVLFVGALAAADAAAGDPAEESASSSDIEPTPAPTETPGDEASSPTDLDPPIPTAAPTAAPTAEPEADIVFLADGMTAVVTGEYAGLYVRVALIVDTRGQSGLYVTQVEIKGDGTVVIPTLPLPGMNVRGVNIALVRTPEDIQKSTLDPVASVFRRYDPQEGT